MKQKLQDIEKFMIIVRDFYILVEKFARSRRLKKFKKTQIS